MNPSKNQISQLLRLRERWWGMTQEELGKRLSFKASDGKALQELIEGGLSEGEFFETARKALRTPIGSKFQWTDMARDASKLCKHFNMVQATVDDREKNWAKVAV